jgi:uroporphyrinogen decarboxylase
MEAALAMPPGEVAAALYESYRASGTDIIWGAPSAGNLLIKALGGSIKFRPEGPPDVTETILKNIADIKNIDTTLIQKGVLAKIWEITGAVTEVAAKDDYPVAASMWGPITLAGLMYGAEPLMRDIRKNPAGVHQLLDFTTELYILCAKQYHKLGVDIVSMGEPTASGDMISRDHFEEFVFPQLKKIYSALREMKLRGILHICGNITNRLDLAALSGAHLISIDYKVDITSARAALAGKTALGGNIDPVNVIRYGTEKIVAAAAHECIAKALEGEGPVSFMLMPGCDIPPATPPENIRALADSARSYIIGGS